MSHEIMDVATITIDLQLERSYMDYQYCTNIDVDLPDGHSFNLKRDSDCFHFSLPGSLSKEQIPIMIEHRARNEFMYMMNHVSYSLWRELTKYHEITEAGKLASKQGEQDE